MLELTSIAQSLHDSGDARVAQEKIVRVFFSREMDTAQLIDM